MFKLAIPTILIATILVAGILALMPIDKASTVHTVIQGTQINEVADQVATVCSTNLFTDPLVATSNRDFLVMYQITAAAAIASPTMTDGTNTLVLAMGNGESTMGMLAYPADTVVTFSDPDITNPADGCATVITEAGGTGSVT